MLKSGDSFLENLIQVEDTDGNLTNFKINNKALIFIFTTTCDYCLENKDVWNDLFERYSEQIEIIGILCDADSSSANYISQNGIKFKVIKPVDDNFRKANKIFIVPQTILLNEDIKIQNIWTGILSNSALNEINKDLKDLVN